MSINRYIQVQTAPATPFSQAATTARYTPPNTSFRANASYDAHLLDTVYGSPRVARTFATVYVEGNTHLRAQIGFTSDFSILVLDHLYNGRAGDQTAPNVGVLVHHFLTANGANPANVGLIIIPNIANANTRAAITQFLNYEGVVPGHWASPDADHGRTILGSELGITAQSVARRLGQSVQAIYLGTLSNQPAFAAALGVNALTYPPAQARVRPVKPAKGKGAKKSKNDCGCIVF